MSSAGDPNAVTAGVVAGIVICSLLFLVVVALVAYNIYLWHRRRTADRQARQRRVNQKYDTGWRPSDVLYAPQDERFKRGSGNVNPAYAPSTAGSTVAGSTASMNSRGVGPAPRAQYEDISDDEEVGTGSSTGNGPYSHKPPRPTLQYQSPPAYSTVQDRKRPPGMRSNGTGNTHAHTPPYSQSVPSPHARPEVTLRPQRLQAEWDRGVPPPVVGVGVGAQHFRAPTRTAGQSQSPQRRLPVVDQRNSCLAVLSADTSRLRTSDVSLTGFGAQYVPSIGLKTSVHNGGLGYNDY